MTVNGVGAIVWLVVSVILFVIESVTYQMICIWFALGALLAMAAAWLGAPLVVQMLFFLLSSIAVLLLARPVVLERTKVRKSATNADLVIGQVGVVKEAIDNELQTGRVTANGLDWTARSSVDGLRIPKDSRVRAVRIEGVKLIVEPVKILEPAER